MGIIFQTVSNEIAQEIPEVDLTEDTAENLIYISEDVCEENSRKRKRRSMDVILPELVEYPKKAKIVECISQFDYQLTPTIAGNEHKIKSDNSIL